MPKTVVIAFAEYSYYEECEVKILGVFETMRDAMEYCNEVNPLMQDPDSTYAMSPAQVEKRQLEMPKMEWKEYPHKPYNDYNAQGLNYQFTVRRMEVTPHQLPIENNQDWMD